jgi:hypothetical protein
MMPENNLLVKTDGGWVWADNPLATQARKEFETSVFALDNENTSKVLAEMLVAAIGAGAVGEDFQDLIIKVVTGAITKIQEDARSAWAFVHENTGLDSLDETDLTYNWPKGEFSLAEPVTENAPTWA